jgi:hypothetical protein
VVQKLDQVGTPYVTQDGMYIVLLNKQQHLLHVFKVGGPHSSSTYWFV